jgi:hypothetical protein
MNIKQLNAKNLETRLDRREALWGLLCGEVKHTLGELGRHLAPHDLTRWDYTDLKRQECPAHDLDARQMRELERLVAGPLEVVGNTNLGRRVAQPEAQRRSALGRHLADGTRCAHGLAIHPEGLNTGRRDQTVSS